VSTRPPVPGVRGLEHVALTVPDMDEAIRFFVDVLGCEHFYDIGPFRDDDGDWFETNLGLDPRCVVPRGALLRCGNGSNFELFQYEAPDQRREMPRMSDVGGLHLAFYVDDIHAAVADLEERGITVLGGIKDGIGVEGGPGTAFTHFYSPWGALLELVSFPQGKAYMEGRERFLWRPHHPADELS
jgi:catechol 2,3-dioxygenase-like lactoylglutathione lyase family enzyme